MTPPAQAGPGIVTAAELRRRQRLLERHLASVQYVLAAMDRGAVLCLSYANGRPLWRLSSGPFVAPETAAAVILHHDVLPSGDTLFAGTASQTYRRVHAT